MVLHSRAYKSRPYRDVDLFPHNDYNTNTYTNFKAVVVLIGLLILFFYHLFYRSNAETTKLSWTTVLTICWLALIIFYPFKDPTNTARGAIGFFTLIGGLAVSILWVRFFSDEIVA